MPLERVGWVPFDPVPTPEEQELLAELAESSRAPRPRQPTEPTTPPREVEPTVELPGTGLPVDLGAPGPRRPRAGRRVDLPHPAPGRPAPPAHRRPDRRGPRRVDHRHRRARRPRRRRRTPAHADRGGAPGVPARSRSACRASLAGLAPIVDRARYSGDAGVGGGRRARPGATSTPSTTASAIRGPPASSRSCHPVRQVARLRSTVGLTRRAAPWHAELPDTAVISSSEAPDDIPDVSIEARIGDGADRHRVPRRARRVRPPGRREGVPVRAERPGLRRATASTGRSASPARCPDCPTCPSRARRRHHPDVTGRPYLVSTLYDGGHAARSRAPGRSDDGGRVGRDRRRPRRRASRPCTSSA